MRDKARVALCVGLGLLACGPSLTTVHDGTVRFEHCYGIDLDPSSEPPQRKACWQLWMSAYTVGQPRDRIEYAERRLHALDGDDSSCPKLSLDAEHRPEERQFYLAVPAPTSVHTTPAPIATVVETADGGAPLDAGLTATDTAKATAQGTGAATTASNASGKEPPATSCVTACQDAWQHCDTACAANATNPKCARCKPDYGRCMRGCFD